MGTQEDSDVTRHDPSLEGLRPREQTSERLLALLELADGPVRDADHDIAALLGYTAVPSSDACMLWRDPSGKYIGMTPRFTTSLDAALTLVPEGMWWEMGRVCADDSALRHFGGGNTHSAKVDKWGGFGRPSYASTPALALCIAALRARQAKP